MDVLAATWRWMWRGDVCKGFEEEVVMSMLKSHRRDEEIDHRRPLECT